jgi:hypothetical protein
MFGWWFIIDVSDPQQPPRVTREIHSKTQSPSTSRCNHSKQCTWMLSNLTKWWINQSWWVREEWLGSLGCILNRNGQERERAQAGYHTYIGPQWNRAIMLKGSTSAHWLDAPVGMTEHILSSVQSCGCGHVSTRFNNTHWPSTAKSQCPRGSVKTECSWAGPDVASPRLLAHAHAPSVPWLEAQLVMTGTHYSVESDLIHFYTERTKTKIFVTWRVWSRVIRRALAFDALCLLSVGHVTIHQHWPDAGPAHLIHHLLSVRS